MEIIVNSMNEIMRILCLKMYGYGKNKVHTITTVENLYPETPMNVVDEFLYI